MFDSGFTYHDCGFGLAPESAGTVIEYDYRYLRNNDNARLEYVRNNYKNAGQKLGEPS
jgi:hypothetical protein